MCVVHTDGITVHDDGIHWRTPPFQCCVTATSRLCEAPRSEEYKHQKISVLSTVMGQCAWCNRNPALWLIERVDLGSTDPSCPVRSAVPYMNTFKLSLPSQATAAPPYCSARNVRIFSYPIKSSPPPLLPSSPCSWLACGVMLSLPSPSVAPLCTRGLW